MDLATDDDNAFYNEGFPNCTHTSKQISWSFNNPDSSEPPESTDELGFHNPAGEATRRNSLEVEAPPPPHPFADDSSENNTNAEGYQGRKRTTRFHGILDIEESGLPRFCGEVTRTKTRGQAAPPPPPPARKSFPCKFPGCGRTYGRSDAALRHYRKMHQATDNQEA